MATSHARFEDPRRLLIFSCPFSRFSYPPLSLFDRHTFSEDRLGIGRDGNVLRSRKEKERGQRLLTGAAGQIPSWIRVSGISRLSSKKKERGTSLSLPPSAPFAPFRLSRTSSNDTSLSLPLSLSLGLSTCSRLPFISLVFRSTCLPLDLFAAPIVMWCRPCLVDEKKIFTFFSFCQI